MIINAMRIEGTVTEILFDVTAVPEPGQFNDLIDAFPNPFNGSVVLRYSVSERSDVALQIYNARGRRIRTLIDSRREPGVYEIIWNGRDDDGRELPAGLYVGRLNTGRATRVVKIIKTN
jgi:hypothetical protein